MLVKKTDFNTKITEVEKKVTDHNHVKCIATTLSLQQKILMQD